jgi:MerR family transcriptional regulator, light-induced transcriptional regulator
MTDERAVLRIGEVARRTDVAVPTLRAWERRYGLLAPRRTEGGHRLYSEADVERVRRMGALLAEGWQAGAAAREVLRGPEAVVPVAQEPDAAAAEVLIGRLEAAIDAFDAPGADQVVDDVFARLEIPRALDDVLLPVLRMVGEGWQEDPRVIAREHFATNTLRPRLQRLLRPAARSAGRACIAAAPEHEEHDLGLLAGAVVAADAGWRVHYLGARTPTAALERSASELGVHAVLVGAVYRAHAEEFLEQPPQLNGAGLVLGGGGFLPADADRLPTAMVHQGPIRSVPEVLEQAVALRSS